MYFWNHPCSQSRRASGSLYYFSGCNPESILRLLCGVTCSSYRIILASVSSSTGVLVVASLLNYYNRDTHSCSGMLSSMVLSKSSSMINTISGDSTGSKKSDAELLIFYGTTTIHASTGKGLFLLFFMWVIISHSPRHRVHKHTITTVSPQRPCWYVTF